MPLIHTCHTHTTGSGKAEKPCWKDPMCDWREGVLPWKRSNKTPSGGEWLSTLLTNTRLIQEFSTQSVTVERVDWLWCGLAAIGSLYPVWYCADVMAPHCTHWYDCHMVSHDCHMIKQTPWHHFYDMPHKSSTMHPSWLQHYTHWYDCHMTQGDREVLHFVALILLPLQPYDHKRVVAEYQPASPVSLTSKVPHPLLYFDPKLLSGGNGPIYTRVSYRIIFIVCFFLGLRQLWQSS